MLDVLDLHLLQSERDYPPLSWRLFPSSFDRLFPLTSASNWPRPKKTTKADAKVHSSTFISCHPIAAERGIVRLYPVRPKSGTKNPDLLSQIRILVVEVTGFEPATFWSRTKRATKLRYTSLSMEPMKGLEPLTC